MSPLIIRIISIMVVYSRFLSYLANVFFSLLNKIIFDFCLTPIVVGWLVAAPLFFTLFLIPRHEHTQTPTYQNTREHFEHIFEQLSQQSNRAVALSVQSADSDQQVRIQALNRPVTCLDVCVCVFGCFLSIIVLQSCLFEGISPSLLY